MTDTEIVEARKRLKELRTHPPTDTERNNRGRRIVERLYDEIASLRALGVGWAQIQKTIGPKVADWKPKTLERYFQLVRKQAGTAEKPKGRLVAGRKARPAGNSGSTAGLPAKTGVPAGEVVRPKYNPNVLGS